VAGSIATSAAAGSPRRFSVLRIADSARCCRRQSRGGADREPALPNRRRAVAADELLAHVVDEERFGLLRDRRARLESEWGVDSAAVRRPVDFAAGQHRLQHLSAPRLGDLRIPQRVVQARRLRQPGEQRRLSERQTGRRLGEVRLRRRLDAVCLLPVEHGVQVGVEDVRLRPAVGELVGETALLQLAPDGPLAAEIEVPHELLRQRRAALGDARRRHVRDRGAHHRHPVRAALVVEATVLDRDRRLRQLRVDPAQGHGLVDDRRAERGEALPVGGVEIGAPADAVLLQPAEIAGDEEVRAALMDLQS
jgi:hypothetical protein